MTGGNESTAGTRRSDHVALNLWVTPDRDEAASHCAYCDVREAVEVGTQRGLQCEQRLRDEREAERAQPMLRRGQVQRGTEEKR